MAALSITSMKTPRILAGSIATFILTATVHAQTWDGGGANDNLGTAANWNPDGVPGVTADVIFGGVVRLTPNVSGAFQVNSLIFNNTAGAFVFGGASTLSIKGGGLVNNDTTLQTFNNPVSFGLAVTTSTINAASGALNLNGPVTLAPTTLTLDGANAIIFGSTITGTGAITKTGAGAFNFDATATPIGADFNLNAGTTTLVASGTTQVFTSASVLAINNTASLILNESATLDGAQLTRASGAVLGLAAGKTLTVQSGGDAIITGGFSNTTASTITVTGAGSTFSATSTTFLHGGSTTNVLAGGSLSIAPASTVVGSTGSGTLLVSGAGSTFGTSTFVVAQNGATGTATFSLGALGTLATNLIVGGGSSVGTTGTLNIQSGATFTAPTLSVATSTNAVSGTITINGAGSALTISGTSTSSIGSSAGSSGTVNVQSGGTYNTGAADLLVNTTGTLAIAGGTVNANGNIILNGSLTRDAAGTFTLPVGKTLTMQNSGDALFTGAYATGSTSVAGGDFLVTGAGSTFQTTGQLSVAGGSTMNVVNGGSLFSVNAVNVGTSGAGSLTVDGAGSSANALASSTWGSGSTATVTFSNAATGSFIGSLLIAASSLGGTAATVSILSGATVSSGSLSVASAGGGSSGSLTIDGATSAMTLGGASTFTLGSSFTGPGTLTLQNGGTINAGTGTATVNSTGTLAINGGTYNANGNLTLNGGQLTRNGAGTLTLAQDKTLTVQAGGDAVITGLFQQLNRANLNVTGAGSTFTTTGDFQWEGGNNTLTLVSVQSGGLLSSGGSLHLGRNNTAVAMTVNGVGSQVIASPFFTSEWQAGVLLVNGGSATLGGVRLADQNFGSSSSASLTVQSGSTVSLANLAIATQIATATGELTVEGTGSAVTQTGASTLTLGAAFATTATMSVNNGGAFTSGTGTFTFNPTATLNVGGGTAMFNGILTNNGGVVNFTSGALLFTNPGVNLTVGNSGLLGQNVTLTGAQRLLIGGTTTIEQFRALTLNGGTFTTGALVNNGTLAFTNGTLAITGAGGLNIGTGALGSNVTLGTGANLQVTNTATIASGALLRVNGGSFSGGSITNNGTIDHRDGTLDFTGTLNNAAGSRLFVGGLSSSLGNVSNAGTITLQNGIGLLGGAGTITNTGSITGDGTIGKAVTNSASGQLRAEAGKTLTLTGTVAPNAGTYSLEGGTLDFTDAITNSATGTITGFGALRSALLTNQGNIGLSGDARFYGDVTNAAGARIITSGGSTTTFFDDVIHNGTEIRTSAGGASVFFGAVSGAGPFTGTGTVYFEGDLRPGNSPASVLYEGDLVFGGASTLTLELGGNALGSQYDHLNVGGTLFADGALEVLLYDGFAPHFGDTFDLFDTGAIIGSFDDVNLPDLTGDLTWDDSQLSTSGTLRVVPEPGVGMLLASALAVLGRRRMQQIFPKTK